MKSKKIYIRDCLASYFSMGSEMGLVEDDLVTRRDFVYVNGDYFLKYTSKENQNMMRLEVDIPLGVEHHKVADLTTPALTFDFHVPEGERCFFKLVSRSNSRVGEILFEEGDDTYRVDLSSKSVRRKSVYTAIEELVRQFAKDYKKK